MDSKPRGCTSLAEACFRGAWSIRRVVMGSVDMSIAATVEYVQKSLDIFAIIEMYKPGGFSNIADL
jgi:hypothetical protein